MHICIFWLQSGNLRKCRIVCANLIYLFYAPQIVYLISWHDHNCNFQITGVPWSFSQSAGRQGNFIMGMVERWTGQLKLLGKKPPPSVPLQMCTCLLNSIAATLLSWPQCMHTCTFLYPDLLRNMWQIQFVIVSCGCRAPAREQWHAHEQRS